MPIFKVFWSENFHKYHHAYIEASSEAAIVREISEGPTQEEIEFHEYTRSGHANDEIEVELVGAVPEGHEVIKLDESPWDDNCEEANEE